MFYYADTMQAKVIKLMASKLVVAGIIEGSLSEEGLAAMSDVKDLTSQMAKELALGIKDNVEDIAAAFKKMAIINPHRERVQPTALPVVATGEKNEKAMLKCVHLRFTQDGLRAAGSDGRCVVTAKGDSKSTGNFSVLIPAASLGRLAQMCEDKDEFRV